jgi:1-acyl-sn-glycerol-3-phosphate acyltransferase
MEAGTMEVSVVRWAELLAADAIPRRKPATGGLKYMIAVFCLWARGWKAIGDPPDLKKFVIVAAPHTSWWDGFWMVAFSWRWGMDLQWLVKDTVAPAWMKWIIRSLGGILVNRSGAHGLVGQLAEEYRTSDELHIAIPPEGTRSKGEFWKSGFYFVAKEANVPICLSYLDYSKRRGGFGPVFHPTGNLKADMDRVRAFYEGSTACYPEKFTPPRLREEQDSAE